MPQLRIQLTDLSPRIEEKFGSSIGYRRLYMMALDGKIPAQRDGSRWYVLEDNLDLIAATLGLTARKAVNRGRGRSVEQVAA